LPPPPGGVKLPPPTTSGIRTTPTSSPSHQVPPQQTTVSASSNVDLLLGVGADTQGGQSVPARPAAAGGESWGDFASAAKPRWVKYSLYFVLNQTLNSVSILDDVEIWIPKHIAYRVKGTQILS
jgi:hypothetical protein